MTTMRDAVSKVSRLLGVTMAGQEPTGADAADILDHLQGAIDRLPGLRNGPWTDVFLTTDAAYDAKDGERVVVEDSDPVITIPAVYVDECGRTRVPGDLSRVHVVNDGLFVFSASLGAWRKTDALAAGDPFPFGDEDLPGIIALTVVEAAEEYGAQVSQLTASRAEATLTGMTARFWRGLPAKVDPGLRSRYRGWR